LFKSMAPSRSQQRALYVLASLSGFYAEAGMDEPPLVAPVIEAYCVLAEPCWRSSTRGTYRSVLRRLSGDPAPRLATPFPGARAKAPYSAVERAELWSMAHGQRSPWRVHSMLALVCLCLGAGLRAREVVAACGDDVARSRAGITLEVGGELPRVVPVGREWAGELRRLAAVVGGGPLFHPEEADRSYPNFVNDFCRQLVGDPAAPRLSVARARSSFVCDHLRDGTPLSELLAMTGIAEVESLLYYSRQVPGAPQSKAALRARLATR
jgi:integrase